MKTFFAGSVAVAERNFRLSEADHQRQRDWLAGLAAGGSAAEEAAQSLFKAYEKPTVQRLRGTFELSLAEAEDVWQDTVLALFEYAGRLREGKDLVRLLNSIANNRARNLINRAWRRQDQSLAEECTAAIDQGLAEADFLAAADEWTEAQVAGSGLLPAMDGALELAYECADLRLGLYREENPDAARWLLARLGERRPIPALATELGCPETAMRKRLERMRRGLEKFLQPCLDLLNQT